MAKNNKKETAVVEIEVDAADVVEVSEVAEKSKENFFTYVGGGEDSPRVINFMGLQKFVRGQFTEVTNPEVLAKIKNNQCFVNYEVDETSIYEADEDAKLEADRQRKIDQKTNAAYMKKFVVEE
jgi:hypothetical protein